MMGAGPCIVWIAGAGADYASTRYAIREGAVEANPLAGQGAARQAAIQAGFAAGGCAIDAKLRREGHQKAAKWLRVGFLALKLALAAHNVRAVR